MEKTNEENLAQYISATRIRLRKTSPFFAALSLYAEIDFNQDVPGLLFILKGKLRLLDKNNSGEIFTLKTFSEGKYIGAIQLLRGVLNQSIAASDNVSGLLFPSNKFIKLKNLNKKIPAKIVLTTVQTTIAIDENIHK